MSIDIVASHTLTAEEAERLTSRIRLLVGSVADTMGKLRDLVHEAKSSGAHDALGYASWSAYLLDLFGDEPLRLTRDVRRELVAELSEQGLSTRAIAPIVGVSKDTVQRDIAGVSNETPAAVDDVLDALDRVHEESRMTLPPVITFDTATGEVVDAPTVTEVTETHTVKTVTGLDGKTYKTPAPKAPKPVMSREAAEQDNAEQASVALADAVFTLWGLTFKAHRDRLADEWWPAGSGAVPPSGRDLVTSDNFRIIADALNQFADEWEARNGDH